MRYYITLNETKEKDKLIIDFLEKQYNAKDYITQILYQYATNSPDLHLVAPNKVNNTNNMQNTNEQIAPICTETTPNEQIENFEIASDLMKMFEG